MVEISSMYDAKTSFIELEYALNSRALLIKYISYFVTSSTPWETNRYQNSQETPRFLWRMKIYNSQPIVHKRRQIHPVHILPPTTF